MTTSATAPPPVEAPPEPTAAPVPSPPRRRFSRKSKLPYLLITPVVLVLVAVALWPVIKIITLSMEEQHATKYDLFHGGGSTQWVWFKNFKAVLTDTDFWSAAGRTVVFTAVCVTVSALVGLGVALLLNRVSKWARITLVATLLFAWAVPSTVSTQVFYWLFSNQYGVVNYLLDKIPGLHMQGHDWFADPHQGMAVVALVVIWGATPLLAISLHAGITQIPTEVIEAARIDGASSFAVLRLVILPYLRPLLAILLTLSVIWDFGVFNQIWFMRNGHPEPGYQTLGLYMYSQGVGSSHYNTGATIAILMMVGLVGVVVVYVRQFIKIEEEA
jgi:N,N'-diacetylchitobiose transport system permease protein